MRKRIRILWLLLAALTIPCRTDCAVERMTAYDIAHLNESSREIELQGTVVTTVSRHFILRDSTGCCCCTFYDDDTNKVTRGDVVRVHALVEIKSRHQTDYARVKGIQIIKRGNEPDIPEEVDVASLSRQAHDFKKISLTGTVTEVFVDETDPTYTFLNIEASGGSALLVVMDSSANIGRWRNLTDKIIRASGVIAPPFADPRRCQEQLVMVDRKYPIHPVPENELKDPERFPHRQEFSGEVIALCDNQTFYLRTDANDRLRVHLSDDTSVPNIGNWVTVAGFVRSNFFFVSLTNTKIVKQERRALALEPAVRTTPRSLLYSDKGRPSINPQYEGMPIKICGKMLSVADAHTPDAKITLDCDGINVSVRIGTTPPPSVGSLVEASGICSISTEATGIPNGFIRLTGFSLIARHDGDIVVLVPPPWWTPWKLLSVIFILTAVIVAFLVWNTTLRAVAERRGRELMAEQLGRVSSELKVGERTRLAVELHDALSQNLTGVSLQLDAVKRFAAEDPNKMNRHLDLARRTLKSCRDELRNCLWDLRNRALEEKDLNEAIHRTVSPFIGEAKLLLRFNIPREQISDNATHALMRIVRELATNAVRHGNARTIRIAGALEDGKLLFSVNDDGIGFDQQNQPGVNDGHFGLDGIRERIRSCGGEIVIDTAHGRGCTVKIRMNA